MDKRFQSIRSKWTVIIFLILLGGLAVGNLLTPTRTFSEQENRYLQTFPTFSTNALVKGTFTADFDQYITDQFFFRDGWVGMKTLAERAMHKQSSGGVYFGDDDYLIEMFTSVDADHYTKNLDNVAVFSQHVRQELGKEVHTMLVPTASLLLADKLPAHTPEVDQKGLLAQASDTVPGFVDVSTALAEHSDAYIYYKTDHHWTSLGAFYAYNAWRAQAGESVADLDAFSQEVLSDQFFGTTYSKASLYTASPDTITAMIAKDLPPYTVDYTSSGETDTSMYERSFLDKKDKYSVFLNGNQPVAHISTGNPNGETLLLIKDSYANSFVQMALPDYADIYVLDLRYYKQSVLQFIEEQEIDSILLLYSIKVFSTDTNLYYLMSAE